jgi:hypothetical protein
MVRYKKSVPQKQSLCGTLSENIRVYQRVVFL